MGLVEEGNLTLEDDKGVVLFQVRVDGVLAALRIDLGRDPKVVGLADRLADPSRRQVRRLQRERRGSSGPSN